ncbi:hypothetical protein V8F06_010919, partial [Rhypophila decipiens]
EQLLLREASGMSPNYQGDPRNLHNHSANHLDDSQNCSFWLEKLPCNVTVHEILRAIADFGRVYALHINRGMIGSKYDHAGAKLVFFDCASAQRFFVKHDILLGSFVVRGAVITVKRNRIKTPEQSGLSHCRTRCLLVDGPTDLVNPGALLTFLRGKLEFELDRVVIHRIHPAGRIEIRFSSYRGQAASAFKALCMSQKHTHSSGFKVTFTQDPCAPLDRRFRRNFRG